MRAECSRAIGETFLREVRTIVPLRKLLAPPSSTPTNSSPIHHPLLVGNLVEMQLDLSDQLRLLQDGFDGCLQLVASANRVAILL